MGLTVGEAIWASVKPIIKIYMIIATGFGLAKGNILTVAATRTCSDIVLTVLLPSLSFNKIVSSIDYRDAKDVGIICLTAVMIFGTGLFFAFVVRKVLPVPKKWRGGILAGGTFPNISDLPIAILQTMDQGLLFTEEEADKGIASVIIFLAMFMICIFNLGGFRLIEMDFEYADEENASIQTLSLIHILLCALFKIGNCNKGARCKFSHDMNVGRRVEKRDLYQDTRSEKEEDTMDNWDEAKLRSVILSKHGNPRTTTEKVCKYFIEAVENGKYGWFWICPNGGDKCMYKHSLPEGFVLKTKEQKRLEMEAFEKKPKITLEEFIETERERLDKRNLTPITMDNFAEWKKNHRIERLNLEKENNLKKKPSGREVVLKKYTEDKRFDLVDETDSTNGSAWDLTEFTKALRDEDSNGSSGIKDYGDGSNPCLLYTSRCV